MVLALSTIAAPVSAQDAAILPPVTAAPPQNILPQALPAISPDAPMEPTQPPEAMAPEPTLMAPRVNSAVVVGDLGTIDGPPAGTLDSARGGLGADAWQGSDRATMMRILESLPVAAPSGTVRLLLRKALLTPALPPLGRADKSFNALRVTRLLDAGLVEDAADLAYEMRAPTNMEIVRAQADSFLYAGRDEPACSDLTINRSDSAEPFWVELRAYCYAVTGNTTTLELTRTVIEEQGLSDPAFLTLLDGMVSGTPVAPTVIRLPDAVHSLMLARLKLPMTREMALEEGLPDALLVAASVETAQDLRIAAATRAFRADLLPVAQARGILDLWTFTPGQLIGAPALARAEPLMDALARLRAGLRLQSAPDARAEYIHAAFEIGQRAGLLGPVARLFAEEAGEIVPARDWGNWSDLMIRGLMLAGRPDSAMRWYDILDPRDPLRADMVSQLQLTLALAQANGVDTLLTNSTLLALAIRANPQPPPPPPPPPLQYETRAILDALGMPVRDPMGLVVTEMVLIPPPPPPPPPEVPKPPAAIIARGTLNLGLFDALARPMPAEAREAVAPLMAQQSAGRRPAAELMQRIDRASLAGARGEVALAVAAAIGGQGAGDLAPDVVVRLVRALRTAGIDDGARLLSIEALLLRPAGG